MPGETQEKLLSIAIPTFNRCGYLDLSLGQIFKQWRENEKYIEVIVCDNHSTDDTEKVVKKYISNGFNIRYVKNDENIESDRNFIKIFGLAKGKYVILFADDEVFLDDSLSKIVNFINEKNFGIVFLNCYGYVSDFRKEMYKAKIRLRIYGNKLKFINKVNWRLAFVSSVIVNKSFVDKDIDTGSLVGSNLPQLAWTFSALFNSDENALIEGNTFASKINNSGGYRLCNVFGVNMNRIFNIFINKGINRKYFDAINRHLLKTFFPNYIVVGRKKDMNYLAEDCFSALLPIYSRCSFFWLFTVPTIKLPLFVAKTWVRLINLFQF